MNDESVEQAIRRHERWLADHEEAIRKHAEAMQRHDQAMQRVEDAMQNHAQAIQTHDEAMQSHAEANRKHDESRQEFWAAMRAATERPDRMDRRLDRFEREGRRRLAQQGAKLERMDLFFQWFQNWIKGQSPSNGGP